MRACPPRAFSADIIYVLSRGTGAVVESGSHRELVAKDGEYARLVKMQSLAVG